jgi:hypothetical protein
LYKALASMQPSEGVEQDLYRLRAAHGALHTVWTCDILSTTKVAFDLGRGLYDCHRPRLPTYFVADTCRLRALEDIMFNEAT